MGAGGGAREGEAVRGGGGQVEFLKESLELVEVDGISLEKKELESDRRMASIRAYTTDDNNTSFGSEGKRFTKFVWRLPTTVIMFTVSGGDEREEELTQLRLIEATPSQYAFRHLPGSDSYTVETTKVLLMNGASSLANENRLSLLHRWLTDPGTTLECT